MYFFVQQSVPSMKKNELAKILRFILRLLHLSLITFTSCQDKPLIKKYITYIIAYQLLIYIHTQYTHSLFNKKNLIQYF